MKEDKTPKPDFTLRTTADVQRVLQEARHLAELSDLSGADAYLQRIKRLVDGEATVEAALVGEMTQVRDLWLAALADLADVCETQEAYRTALAYMRILSRNDPTREPDLRRLIHLYVLSGSRAPTLTTLQRRFAAALQGQGSLVLIRGVAGIGKTSTAQVCTAWARRQGAIFVTGRCYAQG